MTDQTIPAGYLRDAQDRLVPVANIPDVDLLRNDLVQDLVGDVRACSAGLAKIKGRLLARMAEHIALVASDYNVEISGTNGACSLVSYDGRCKIERSAADRIAVGEQIHAAEALVREYLADATREAGPALVAIVDRAFRRNAKTQQLNVSRLLDFVAVKIDDQRWRNAQQAIRDSLQAQGSVTYFRAYEREAADLPWRQIPLDFSAIAPAPVGAAPGRDEPAAEVAP